MKTKLDLTLVGILLGIAVIAIIVILASRFLSARSSARNKARFIDVSKVDDHYFADDSGKTWIPIGCNICFFRSSEAAYFR